jgi:hypothetical protein
LEHDGEVITAPALPTRGGSAVATIQPANQRKRGTAIARAAGRKRLLYARYLGWARGTARYPHGMIGPAGERAVRSAIIDSAFMQTHTHLTLGRSAKSWASDSTVLQTAAAT